MIKKREVAVMRILSIPLIECFIIYFAKASSSNVVGPFASTIEKINLDPSFHMQMAKQRYFHLQYKQ